MLKGIPSEHHLARLYSELARCGAESVGEKRPWPYHPQNSEELFCLACEMSRFDPRLMTILLRFLVKSWKKLCPRAMRALYPTMKTPQTLAVIAEFALGVPSVSAELKYFCRYLQQGLEPVPYQFYFQHLYPVGGHLAGEAAELSLTEYKRWGFLAREAPVIEEAQKKRQGRLDKASRRNILRRLVERNSEVTIDRYRRALGSPLSRQQALLDLKEFGDMIPVGKGRGARWRAKI